MAAARTPVSASADLAATTAVSPLQPYVPERGGGRPAGAEVLTEPSRSLPADRFRVRGELDFRDSIPVRLRRLGSPKSICTHSPVPIVAGRDIIDQPDVAQTSVKWKEIRLADFNILLTPSTSKLTAAGLIL
jgi:hypothetical protein